MKSDSPTSNAEMAVALDRFLAAHVAGDIKVREAEIQQAIKQRADLKAHFKANKLCPTCGHRLVPSAVVAASPS